MRLLPRVRLLLARRPWIYWLGITGLIAVIALSVVAAVDRVDRQRDAWGETTNVVVATAGISPGEDVGSSVKLVALPVAVVPQSALLSIPSGLALQHVALGEIVVEADVSEATGPAALLPAGWLGVPVEVAHPHLFAVGDRSVVFAFGQVVAPDAIVTAVGDDFVVVGVTATDASRVADAAHQRLATLALG